jgi:hypothetical protein
MRRKIWLTTVSLVTLAATTVVIDGCSDDGVGTAPGSLYAINRGDSGEPIVSSETTPTGTNTPPNQPVDSGVDARDARPNPNPNPNPNPTPDAAPDAPTDSGAGADADADV